MTAPSIIASHLRKVGLAYLRAQRAAAHALSISLAARHIRAAAAAALLSIAFGGAALALVAGPNLRGADKTGGWIKESIPSPDLTGEIEAAVETGNFKPLHLTARPSETLMTLFARLGIKDAEAYRFIQSHAKAEPLCAPQAGQYVTAGIEPDGRLAYLRLFMEGLHKHDSRTVEVMRVGGSLALSVLPYNFTTRSAYASGTVGKTLWNTAQSMALPQEIVDQLETVWDGADNPVKAMKPGDALRVVYEKKFADGRFVRNGRLLGVQIVEDGRRVTTPRIYEAFWFSDGTASGSYYTLDGRSASQTFMRVPLDVKDISSEFAPLRRHPITGELRPHNGTDMRAPSNSLIFAAADGKVTLVAFEKRGYGNYVKIDHGLGRTTLYAHMRRVAKGIKPGVRVKKGQVIGYVGMTGLATGPHLHYELMIDGVQINPKTSDLPDTENLTAYQLAQLRAQAAPMQAQFEAAAQHEGKPSPMKILASQNARDAQAQALAQQEEADELAREKSQAAERNPASTAAKKEDDQAAPNKTGTPKQLAAAAEKTHG